MQARPAAPPRFEALRDGTASAALPTGGQVPPRPLGRPAGRSSGAVILACPTYKLSLPEAQSEKD